MIFAQYIYLKFYITEKRKILDSYSDENKVRWRGRKNRLAKFTYNPSECECRRNEKIVVEKFAKFYTISNSLGSISYDVDSEIFEKAIFTCSLYNTFRRGPNQRVLSFSLYGKESLYYTFLKDLVHNVYRYYPKGKEKWLMRIYHDGSINKTAICELECLKNEETSELYDLVDFCDIEKIPVDLRPKNSWNASYMHGMTWRWLPIGDSFVDFFGSRDTDSWISSREVASVEVWLKENTLFHIMRGKILTNFLLLKNSNHKV